MAAGDLCEYDDVVRYVPAYSSVDQTDQTIVAFITAQSELFQEDADREIAQRSEDPETRRFTVTELEGRSRRVAIGDLSTIEDVTVTLFGSGGDEDEDLAADYVPLYEGKRAATAGWKPITELAFPRRIGDSPDICQGKVVEVTGIWGFPAVPAFVREAVAARVILRYLTDVAVAGTDFANALADTNVNVEGLLDSIHEALQAVQRKEWP